MQNNICLGFGVFEGICNNTAGTAWTPYWCTRCDELRKESITESLKGMITEIKERSCQEK